MRREVGYFEGASKGERAMRGSCHPTFKESHLRVPMATKENFALIALRTASLGNV
jgi:hypothetical protein